MKKKFINILHLDDLRKINENDLTKLLIKISFMLKKTKIFPMKTNE